SWQRDDFWGYEVAAEIPGVEIDRFDLKRYYSVEQIKDLSEKLKQERLEWLAGFPGLDKSIIGALKP
ncbi:MAG TPA: phosphoenolpyruvate carboxykinase (ATP), partial [Dehalococcoidia bacterium]|nr:phosphoenolpyruvate carboxykinase (ATP) [Dehalococcoidia bacterium]